MRKLPQVNGWTIDERLQEIRRVTAEGMEFVPFDSPEAWQVLKTWKARQARNAQRRAENVILRTSAGQMKTQFRSEYANS